MSRLVIFSLAWLALTAPAHAAILIVVSPSVEVSQPGGSTVTWSGSGVASEDIAATFVYDLPGDPIDNDGPALLNVNNGEGIGSLSFLEDGIEVLETLQFRETDKVFIDLTGAGIDMGQTYAVSGTLSLSESFLPFARFNPGTYVASNADAIGGLTLSVVPLPAAVWLFGAALGGLAMFRRR